MIGIDQGDLKILLSRIFARHHIPHELREVIWKCLALKECVGCGLLLLYPTEELHECAIFGYSHCSRCIPAHFCLSLDKQPSLSMNVLISALVLSIGGIHTPSLNFEVDDLNKHCAVTGFSKFDAGPIRKALEDLSGGLNGMAAHSLRYGIRGMKIEYVENLKE